MFKRKKKDKPEPMATATSKAPADALGPVPLIDPAAIEGKTGVITPIAGRGSKVPGILDSQLRPELHEAHRVLAAGMDAWQKVLDNIEGQFIRPLLNAHDGDSESCQQVQAQIAAFRTLYE